MSRATSTLAISLALFVIAPSARAADGPVHVFILAGQSNMEGKATVRLLERQIDDPNRSAEVAHLRQNGKWVERDDVFIKFLNRAGKLTVGYGSPDRIGPELQFGLDMGDKYDEPVLLIKTAWGGKSLYADFRPPSAGLPPQEMFEKDLARYAERDKQEAESRGEPYDPTVTEARVKGMYGQFYRMMIDDVKRTLANLGNEFPELQGRQAKLAGFVWFQGWNDMINADYTAAYAENMAHFIRDVRNDLNAPKLPFVIGVMGVGGDKAVDEKQQRFRDAQAAPAALPEFQGNVAVVATGKLWDWEADAVFKKGWQQNLEEWQKVGDDLPYHYLGSVKFHLRAGHAFAEALNKLESEE